MDEGKQPLHKAGEASKEQKKTRQALEEGFVGGPANMCHDSSVPVSGHNEEWGHGKGKQLELLIREGILLRHHRGWTEPMEESGPSRKKPSSIQTRQKILLRRRRWARGEIADRPTNEYAGRGRTSRHPPNHP